MVRLLIQLFLSMLIVLAPFSHADDDDSDISEEEIQRLRNLNCADKDKELERFQKKIFALKDGEMDYLTLLEKRDQVFARIALINAVLKTVEEHNNYLREGQNFSLEKSLKGLDKMREFLGKHNDTIERFELMSEVMNDVDHQELLRIATPEKRYNYLREKISKRCDQEKHKLDYTCTAISVLSKTPIDWDQYKYNTAMTAKPQYPHELLHKFLQLTSMATTEGDQTFKNLSQLFVQKNDFNLNTKSIPGQSFHLGRRLDGYISHAIQKCQLTNQTQCINLPLEEVYNGNINETNFVKFDIKSKTTIGMTAPKIETVGDMIEAFEASVTHDQKKYRSLSQDQYQLLLKATKELKDARLSESQITIKGQAIDIQLSGLKETLGGLYSNEKNLYQPYRFTGQSSGEPIANYGKWASDLFNGLTGQDGKNYFYTNASGEIAISEEGLKFINENASDISDHFHRVLNGDAGLNKLLYQYEQRINKIKNSTEYKELSQLKDYAKGQVVNTCQNSDIPPDIFAPSDCPRLTGTTGEEAVQTLMTLEEGLVNHVAEQEREVKLEDLVEICDQKKDDDTYSYDREYLEICADIRAENEGYSTSPSTKSRKEKKSREEELLERATIRKSMDKKYYFDDEGNVTWSYQPQKAIERILPAAAYSFNQTLPFILSHQTMPYQLEGMVRMGQHQADYNAWLIAAEESFFNTHTCGYMGCFYNGLTNESYPFQASYGYQF